MWLSGSVKKKQKKAPHRPSLYRKEFDRIAFRHALLGATDKEIAAILDVDVATVNRWKIAFSSFCESLKSGKAEADAQVAKCLFGRATGYDAPDTDIRAVDGQIVLTPFIKHYPPDVTAQIFWLKNRQPGKFRDKPAVEVTVNNEVAVDTGKPPEEWNQAELEAELRRREALPLPPGREEMAT